MATMTVQTTTVEHGSVWSSPYAQPRRPWLTLYGLRVRHSQGATPETQVELAPIQKLLPEEMLLKVFRKLPAYQLGQTACVCRHWSALTLHSELWESASREAFQTEDMQNMLRLLRLQYKGSWRTMFLSRPHLRFDGIYVSRNTYIRTGITEWRIKNPVHMVCYFRYLRFMPDGQFLYRTSPEPVAKVARSMRAIPDATRADDSLQVGRWHLNKDRLLTGMRYPNMAGTEIRSRLRLRSTVPGANNRLDVESILSFDHFDGTATSMLDLPSEEDMELEGSQTHRRGLSPYVFVPNAQVADHALNLPISKMDFYLPG